MNAIVLAGGRGERLMPLTNDISKPVLPVAGYPILDYVTAHLDYYGARKIIYAAGYMSESVKNRVKKYRGDRIVKTESVPLGTCGAVKACARIAGERFFVASGDCISDIDLYKMAAYHRKSGALVTIAVKKVPDASEYGAVVTSPDGKITSFREKEKGIKDSLVNLGVYVVEKKALDLVPSGKFFDFARDLFPLLVKQGALYAFLHEGYWSDLGNIKSYYEANSRFKDGFFYPLPCDGEMRKCGSTVSSADSRILGLAENSVVCGKSCISSGSCVRSCVVLGGEVKGVHYKRIIKNGIVLDV